MLVSRNWLQTYFKDKLPEAEKISDFFAFHSFEVDGVEKKSDDEIFDLKILPDRANYALCHRGVAREFSAMSGFEMRVAEYRPVDPTLGVWRKVSVAEPALCSRYVSRLVEKVKVSASPKQLSSHLSAIGERSICNIVDAANFVMFDMGQPLHAFDADKIKGEVSVRLAKDGERITTLDDKDIVLDSSVLIIADDEGPLAIAGIKGGKRAEVTEKTSRLLLESANFNASAIRRAETRLGLKTEASRRFEANLSPHISGEAIEIFSSLIKELSPEAEFSPVSDIYPKKAEPAEISVSADFVSGVLGVGLDEDEIRQTLGKIGIAFENRKGRTVAVAPLWRTDVTIPESVAEEAGRIYGYDKIKAKLPLPIKGRPSVNKNFYYGEKIKNILAEAGFMEVYLYSLSSKGVFEIAKPLAEDKKFLRGNLSDGLIACLRKNAQNASILGQSSIKIFEFGSVFGKDGERTNLAIGAKFFDKKSGNADSAVKGAVNAVMDIAGTKASAKFSSGPDGAVAEIDLTGVFRAADSPDSYADLRFGKMPDGKFKPFSLYPAVLRDLAVFVPENVAPKVLLGIIGEKGGDLLLRTDLFDVFKKDGKISYAFHLVFQSMDRTLTDAEINKVMDGITAKMNSIPGWQVR